MRSDPLKKPLRSLHRAFFAQPPLYPLSSSAFPQPDARKALYFSPRPRALAIANIFLLNRIRFYLPYVISAIDKTFSRAKIRLAPALLFLYDPETSRSRSPTNKLSRTPTPRQRKSPRRVPTRQRALAIRCHRPHLRLRLRAGHRHTPQRPRSEPDFAVLVRLPF